MYFINYLGLFATLGLLMKKFSSNMQKTGELGENIAVRFLLRKGFKVINRNYTQRWGEIDIIAMSKGKFHFIEVKSVSCEMIDGVLCEIGGLRPEDHMDRNKQERLRRTIGLYIQGHKTERWQFDLVCVYIDKVMKKAKVKVFEDLIL